MPEITCPSCGYEFYLDENDYEGEIQCPKCGALLEVNIERGDLKEISLLEEGIEEEEWLEDEDFWEEEEEGLEWDEDLWEEEEEF
ncbi:hypothetical protein J7K19_08405 [bacterium]|nr:hypothetical protein [bacterium]